MYASTRDHKKEQFDFITLFKERISIYENENIIIGGDFTFYLDKTLDKQEGMSEKHDNPEYRKEINSQLESMNLLDIWRIFNPTLSHDPWHSRGKSSRLDYLMISEHLMNETHKLNIMPGLHSDHSIITFQIGNHEIKRGRGL